MECWAESLYPPIGLNHVHGPFLVWWDLQVLWTAGDCVVFTPIISHALLQPKVYHHVYEKQELIP